MHRTMGIDPFEDARTKVKAVVHRGDYVFDTCGGMGYTSIWTRRLGASHTISCELSEDVVALRKYNPYSREYLEDERIDKLITSCAKAIVDFDDDYFDCIIHDPPAFLWLESYMGKNSSGRWRVCSAMAANSASIPVTPIALAEAENLLRE